MNLEVKGDADPAANAEADNAHIEKCHRKPSGWDFVEANPESSCAHSQKGRREGAGDAGSSR